MEIELSDLAAWGGVAVGVASAIVAINANHKAKSANSIAKEALAAAQQANTIAEDANKLGEHANTLAGRALANQIENWSVDFAVHWERERSGFTLVNNGADPALNVTVSIGGDCVTEPLTLGERIERGKPVFLAVPQIGEERAKFVAEYRAKTPSTVREGWEPSLKLFSRSLVLTIKWESGEGFSKSAVFNETVG